MELDAVLHRVQGDIQGLVHNMLKERQAIYTFEIDAAIAQVEALRAALREMRDFARVSYEGDSWYAFNAKIDVDGLLERARVALNEDEVAEMNGIVYGETP